MKNRLLAFLFLTIPFSANIAQTVIKIPFQQPEPFVVQPQTIDKAIDNTSIDLGLEVEIHGGSGNYIFSWVFNNEEIGTNPTININKGGIYTLLIRDGEGCESTVTYTVSGGTGIEDINTSLLIVLYPNPTTGTFSVKTPENQQPDKIEVYNLDGKLMPKENLPTGHYLVSLYFGNKKITKPLIVLK